MTKLKQLRRMTGKKLREIAIVVKRTPQTVQQMENRGIYKRKTAEQYARAFPGLKWDDLMD